MSDDVKVEVVDHVGTVEICRGPNNYFDTVLVRAVADAYLDLADHPDCRAIVLCSEGRNFCAGADFGSGHRIDNSTDDLFGEAARVYEAPLPVVVAVQGAAVGGGLGLAMTADFRVASPRTRFISRFAMLGLHHGFGLTITLPAAVGQQRASELLYTGGTVAGERAHEIGLCDRLAATDDDLRPAAVAFAAELAASAPLAVRAMRATLRRARVDAFRAVTATELAVQKSLQPTADAQEAIAAAAERRAPVFHGR